MVAINIDDSAVNVELFSVFDDPTADNQFGCLDCVRLFPAERRLQETGSFRESQLLVAGCSLKLCLGNIVDFRDDGIRTKKDKRVGRTIHRLGPDICINDLGGLTSRLHRRRGIILEHFDLTLRNKNVFNFLASLYQCKSGQGVACLLIDSIGAISHHCDAGCQRDGKNPSEFFAFDLAAAQLD